MKKVLENDLDEAKIDRRIWFLAFTRFIRALGRVSSFIFLPIILLEFYHLSFILIGVIQGFATLMMSLVQYNAGKWTDRVGRRFFLIIIPIPAAFFYLIMFFVIQDRLDLIYLIAAWYLTIIINALQYPAIQAAVADLTSISKRLTGYTYLRLMANLGAAAGPLIGGFLAVFGFQYIFLVAAISTVVELAILYYSVSETYFPEKNTGKPVKERFSFRLDRFFLLFTIVGLFLAFFTRQRGSTLTLYIFDFKNLPITFIGYIYALNGALVVITQLPILSFMNRHLTPMEWRGVGLIYYAAGFLLTAFSGDLIFFLIVMSIMTIGEDFLAPTTQTIITTLSPVDKRGTYIGMYNLVTSFGAFLGAIIGLFLLSYLSRELSEFWFIFAAGTLMVAIVYLFMGKSYRKRIAVPEITPGTGKS